METIASNTTRIDVEHLGNSQVIACCLLEGTSEAALIDPGPTSSLPRLRAKLATRGICLQDLTAILLTHIHLDHAGATGTLVRENPRLRVYVHERGAPHMIKPVRLLESALRLYGDKMDFLWGEFLAVPEENIQALSGGERLAVCGRTLAVEYTPGHASHHVSYFDDASGIAFTGDTAGIRIANRPSIIPPTPPPDIDLDLWAESLQLIAGRKPGRLFLTHFGIAEPVEEHLARFTEQLHNWAGRVRASLQLEADDSERARRFASEVFEDLKRELPHSEAERYLKGAAPEMCWHGLARYWRRNS